MMKTWKLLIAAILLVAVAAGVRQSGKTETAVDPLVGKGLLAADQIDAVRVIDIRAQDGEAVVAMEEGRWVVPGRGGFPADTAKIEDLFQKVSGTKIVEMVTKNSARHADLGVSKPSEGGKPAGESFVLAMKGKDGSVIRTLYLGKGRKSRAPDGSAGFGTEGQYVRSGDEDASYLVSDRIWLEKNPARWLKSELLKVEAPEIKRISWDFPAESEKDFSIGRELTSEVLALSDVPADHQEKKAQIDGAVRFFANVAMDDVVPVGQTIEKLGLADPVTIVMDTFTGTRVTMRIGTTEIDLPVTGKVNLVSLTASAEGNTGTGSVKIDEIAANGAKFVYGLKNWRVKPLLLKHGEFIEKKPEPKPAEARPAELDALGTDSAMTGSESKLTAEAQPGSPEVGKPESASDGASTPGETGGDAAKDSASDTISASHILLSWKDSDRSKATRTEEEAKKLMEEIRVLLGKGESFESLAEKYSDCPSGKSAKGSLGNFGRGSMVKEFEDAAFGLKPGEISKVVKTKFGYHIIRRDS